MLVGFLSLQNVFVGGDMVWYGMIWMYVQNRIPFRRDNTWDGTCRRKLPTVVVDDILLFV